MEKFSVEWYYEQMYETYKNLTADELEQLSIDNAERARSLGVAHLVNRNSIEAMEMLIFDKRELGI